MSSLQDIKQKILNSERISEAESLTLFRDGNLYDLGLLADFIRKKKHPDSVVTYVIDRNINYTDICISACKFCAFYKAPEDPKGTVITFGELAEKIAETKELRGTQILLQGGLHPDKPLEFYIGNMVPGWNEGLQLICPGGKILLLIPSALAYGEKGFPDGKDGFLVPPNTVLAFEVEVLEKLE